MTERDDITLLREFAATDSEAAFAALVQRHINLVYSTALRSVGSAHAAEEISQAVFIILARKAKSLGAKTIRAGWLHQTTRLTAANFLRGEIRRQKREQEAYMQSTLNEPDANVWPQIAPLLDDALGKLGERDRNAIVLRFLENKSLAEVGTALGASEDAAKMRVNRALEKLRKLFGKRGVALSATLIAGAVSASSVQAAPAGLAKSVTLVAMTKGVAASSSTLTLIKGALKIMAWTKAKTAIVVGGCVLLAAGTAIVTVDEIQEHRTYAWEIPTVYDLVNHSFGFDFSTHQVQVKRSIYPAFKVGMVDAGIAQIPMPDGAFEQTNYGHWTGIGLGMTLDDLVLTAYGAQKHEVIYLTKLPAKPLYDYISCLPRGMAQPLQELIKKKLGIVGKWETRETDVLLLQLSDSNMQRLMSLSPKFGPVAK